MTTGWGASPGLDPAPAVAYRLTAAVAEEDEEAVAKIWADLDWASRARVVAALGAQVRYSAWGTDAEEELAAQFTGVAAAMQHCGERTAALRALAGRPEPVLPSCDGCPRAAIALARARLAILARVGFNAVQAAAICRRAVAPR